MRYQRAAGVFVVFGLMFHASPNWAQEAGGGDKPAETAGADKPGETFKTRPFVVPAIKVSASTGGVTTAKLGADFWFGAGSIVFGLTPTVQAVTSKGTATLFSTDPTLQTGSLPVVAGVVGTVYGLAKVEGTSDAEGAARGSAILSCAKTCGCAMSTHCPKVDPSEDPRGCAAFVKDYKPSYPTAIANEDHLCPEGKLELRAWRASHSELVNENSAFPGWIISLGGLGGGEAFTYLAPVSASAYELRKNVVRGTGSVGAYGAWIPVLGKSDYALTLEASFSGTFGDQPQKAQAQWCTTAGTVTGNTSGGNSVAQVCNKAALGAPGSAVEFHASLDLGLIGSQGGIWRLAIGPAWDRVGADGALGVEFPFYLRFAATGSQGPEGAYKGLVALVPKMEWRAEGTSLPSWQFILTLQLLGQRTMFKVALD